MGRGALPACRPPYPQPAATRSGRAAAVYGSAGPSFWRCAFRRSRRRAYVLYSLNSPLLVLRDLCAQRSTTLRGLEMTAKFVARARARRCAVIARIITRSSSLVMMHPRVRHKHVDYRTGEVSLTTSKRGARELVYFTRGRDGRAPFSFQTDYVPVMSVCCERVRVCVMGRASPAMYPLAYCFAGVSPPRNPFSKNKNWSFFARVPPLAKPK